MTDELELEVVTLVGGPADGEDVEAPVGYLEMWHCTGPGYARYERSDPAKTLMSWTGEQLADHIAMVDWLEARGYVGEQEGPILHLEGPEPRARTVELIRAPYYIETERPQG